MFRWMDEMGIHRWVSHRARSAASLRNSIGTHESTITLNRISSPDKTGENPQQISGFPPTSVANGANVAAMDNPLDDWFRSKEHTSELQSLMRISYAVFCLNKKTKTHTNN